MGQIEKLPSTELKIKLKIKIKIKIKIKNQNQTFSLEFIMILVVIIDEILRVKKKFFPIYQVFANMAA